MSYPYAQSIYRLTLAIATGIGSVLIPSLEANADQNLRRFTTPAASPIWLSFLHIFGQSDPPEPPVSDSPGGSRPAAAGFCPVAPFAMPETAITWSDTPTLTWQSPADLITQVEIVSDADPQDSILLEVSDEHIIRTDLAGDRPIHTYQITPDQSLERGEEYQWWVYRKISDDVEERAPRFVRFQIMAEEESDRITESLQELGYNLETPTMSEPVAIDQAAVFAQEQLWADAWQVILEVPEPSEDLEGAIATALTSVCESEE